MLSTPFSAVLRQKPGVASTSLGTSAPSSRPAPRSLRFPQRPPPRGVMSAEERSARRRSDLIDDKLYDEMRALKTQQWSSVAVLGGPSSGKKAFLRQARRQDDMLDAPETGNPSSLESHAGAVAIRPELESSLHSTSIYTYTSRSMRSTRLTAFSNICGQPRKWLHLLESAHAIIYVVDLSSFDQTVQDQSTGECVNALRHDMSSFHDLCTSNHLLRTSIIVLLNKLDVLTAKLASSPASFTRYFPECDATVSAACAFLTARYKQLASSGERRRTSSVLVLPCSLGEDNADDTVSAMFSSMSDFIAVDRLMTANWFM
ncbi:hypothetical protein HMN09_01087400 [Mycena chlorophos]|uniref:G-alpha-domain-containing protein n=1 Tax=Mycena chlorophos TaxID=658473 RepID=A0A8H6SB43_MYCCL|nr:hypothetical protein HMN09_01087400 [Mycena chlorophos]